MTKAAEAMVAAEARWARWAQGSGEAKRLREGDHDGTAEVMLQPRRCRHAAADANALAVAVVVGRWRLLRPWAAAGL